MSQHQANGQVEPWSDDENAKLIEFAKEGRSSGYAAKALGRSRCAVLGRAKRMRLRFKGGTFSAKARNAAPQELKIKTVKQHLHAGNIAGKKESRQHDPEFKHVTPAVAVEPLLVSLLDLRANQCRFPIGDPLKGGFGFCGHPKEQGSYCRAHARIAYTAPEMRRRAA